MTPTSDRYEAARGDLVDRVASFLTSAKYGFSSSAIERLDNLSNGFLK